MPSPPRSVSHCSTECHSMHSRTSSCTCDSSRPDSLETQRFQSPSPSWTTSSGGWTSGLAKRWKLFPQRRRQWWSPQSSTPWTKIASAAKKPCSRPRPMLHPARPVAQSWSGPALATSASIAVQQAVVPETASLTRGPLGPLIHSARWLNHRTKNDNFQISAQRPNPGIPIAGLLGWVPPLETTF